jgi:hypothetical protein
MNTETKDQIIIDTIQSCCDCGNTFFLAEGVLTIVGGHIEFVCAPCKAGA